MNANTHAKKIGKSSRLLVLATCAGLLMAVMPPAVGQFSTTASWYGPRFHGRKTASGQRFDQNKLTAASRTLPFGTKLHVMNPRNGRKCTVVITDRGPASRSRGLDLSRAAARQLGIRGVGRVVCHVDNSANKKIASSQFKAYKRPESKYKTRTLAYNNSLSAIASKKLPSTRKPTHQTIHSNLIAYDPNKVNRKADRAKTKRRIEPKIIAYNPSHHKYTESSGSALYRPVRYDLEQFPSDKYGRTHQNIIVYEDGQLERSRPHKSVKRAFRKTGRLIAKLFRGAKGTIGDML